MRVSASGRDESNTLAWLLFRPVVAGGEVRAAICSWAGVTCPLSNRAIPKNADLVTIVFSIGFLRTEFR
jgi:hypothetical protein